MYAHLHIYTPTHTYLYTHTRTPICTHLHTNPYITHVHTPIHTPLYTQIHTYIHIHTPVYTHTPVHPLPHLYTRKYIHLHTTYTLVMVYPVGMVTEFVAISFLSSLGCAWSFLHVPMACVSGEGQLVPSRRDPCLWPRACTEL